MGIGASIKGDSGDVRGLLTLLQDLFHQAFSAPPRGHKRLLLETPTTHYVYKFLSTPLDLKPRKSQTQLGGVTATVSLNPRPSLHLWSSPRSCPSLHHCPSLRQSPGQHRCSSLRSCPSLWHILSDFTCLHPVGVYNPHTCSSTLEISSPHLSATR